MLQNHSLINKNFQLA